ncbi:MAG TPA: tetraacyldisaccharide 4'-kinase [Longimicrobiales bacterium]
MKLGLSALARTLWHGDLGAAGAALSLALAPAELLYRMAAGVRNRAYDHSLLPTSAAGIPVISIGNIAVGGSGKTPFTSWLAQRLARAGRHPAIVHGGYAQDEPELHRDWTPGIPVVVDRDRVRAVRRAAAQGADVVLLDDAFQHRRLRRDLDIVLVGVERWQEPVRLLPRGPWREAPSALRRADLIVCVRRTPVEHEAAVLAAALRRATGRDVVRAHLRPGSWLRNGEPVPPPAGPVLLVAGVADPALLEANVRAAGVPVAGVATFPDHHAYTPADAERIRASAAGRTIVTSAKDWIKLKTLLDARQTCVLTQELMIEDGGALLDGALRRVLS